MLLVPVEQHQIRVAKPRQHPHLVLKASVINFLPLDHLDLNFIPRSHGAAEHAAESSSPEFVGLLVEVVRHPLQLLIRELRRAFTPNVGEGAQGQRGATGRLCVHLGLALSIRLSLWKI